MSMEFGKLNFAVGFNRTSAFPLDANSYFESYEAAVAAVAGAAEVGSADSAYYVGQLIIVNDKTEDASKGVGLYQISADKKLIKFGQASSADDLAEQISALQTRCTTIEGKLILADAEHDGFLSKEDFAKIAGIEEKYATKEEVNAKQDKLIAGTDILIAEDGKTIGVDASKFDAAGKAEELVTTHNTDTAAHKDIRDELTSIKNDLDGRTKVYVFQNKEDEAYKAAIAKAKSFKLGDTIYFIDANIPDEWVVAVNKADPFYIFEPIEAKTQIEGYVKDTRTINGKALSADITLGAEDVGADAKGTAQGLIDDLNVEAFAVGAGETIKSVAESKGKIVVEKQSIAIEQSAVNGLEAALAGKVDVAEGKSLVADALITKLEALQDNAVIKSAGDGIAIAEDGKISVDAASIPAIATAKVTGLDDKLTELANLKTQVGADTDEASAEGSVFSRIKQLQSDVSKAGKIDVVKVNGTALEIVDKAVNVEIPEALVKSVSEEFEVSAKGKLSVKAINVNKLEQTEGDTLILDGGTAE